jgi:histidyl-tRNA synthetase
VGSAASRGPYRDLLQEAIVDLGDELSADAIERYRKNPLRIFDSKDHGESMKKRLPVITEHLPAEEMDHYERVKELLHGAGLSFHEDPYLVRGLDYYTKTVFEVYHEEHGAQSALCGGGRYDDLVEQCGGPPTPAIGFSVGLERVIGALPCEAVAEGIAGDCIDYYVVCADDDSASRALQAATRLRRIGNAEVDLSGRSVKKQLQAATKKRARFAVVVSSQHGDDVTWKDLTNRTEELIADASIEDAAASAGKD